MNWSRAKNILIVLFICADLFLLSVIVLFTGQPGRTPDSITEAAVQILKNSGIEADPKLLQAKNHTVYIPEAENIILSYDSFAEKVLGANPEKSENTYFGEKGKIIFTGDSFEYIPAVKVFKDFSLTMNNPASLSSQILSALGISDKNITYNVTQTGSRYRLNISKQRKNMQMFCCSIDVIYTSGGIESISGTWFSETGRESDETELKPVSGLMIDYVSLFGKSDTVKTVDNILEGYYIPSDDELHKKLFLTPCIKITFSDGSEAYVNSAEANGF